MGTISYVVPQAGTDLNATADPEIATALTTIKTLVNGNIDGANVVASLTGRRLVSQVASQLGSAQMGAAGNYYFTDGGATAVSGGLTGGFWLYLDPANFAVTGKGNTQLIVRMGIAVNGTPPAITFAASLNAATFTSSANAIGITVGAVQGSAATVATPAASSVGVAEAGPFTFPTAGAYVPTLNLSGTGAANSAVAVMWQLYVVNS